MTETGQDRLATLLFSIVVALIGADLLSDAGSGASAGHLGIEAVAAVVASGGSLWFLRRALVDRRGAAAWRARAEELLAGVGQTIEAQLKAWGLSPAEGEVALLLLKGLSFKEIAQVRDTSERTARDQARAVYRKAGVAGRAELSAWFIEDLLPPAG